MKSPFSYEAVYYDSVENDYRLECGMALANSYTEATEQIEKYYGETLMIIKNLELFEENNLIILPKSAIIEYRNRRMEDVSVKCNSQGEEE